VLGQPLTRREPEDDELDAALVGQRLAVDSTLRDRGLGEQVLEHGRRTGHVAAQRSARTQALGFAE
jgi:hypothetical protein